MFFSRVLEDKYPPLPTTVKPNSQGAAMLLPKRYIRLILSILTACGISIFFLCEPRQAHKTYDIYVNDTLIRYPDIPYPEVRLTSPDQSSNLPPLYEEYRNYEDRVTEWNLKTYGKPDDKYLYMSSHSFGAGWGNIMQDLVFNTLFASGSGRGLVWDEYIWNNDGSEYSQFNGKFIPSKIPLSAMIAGYMLGLPKSPGLPPSISKRVYERTCPQSDRFYVDELKVKDHMGLPHDSNELGWHLSGQRVLDAWLSYLNSPAVRGKRCVEMTGGAVFTIWVLHTPRIHSMMKTLFSSPVVTNWGWSELVKGAFIKNIHLFVSANPLLKLASLRPRSSSTSWLSAQNRIKSFFPSLQSDHSPLPLLVLHLRRGDYEEHCKHLTKYHSTYVGMVTLPEFEERDLFFPNSTYDDNSIPEEVSLYYTKHCYPNATAIKQRVREVLHDYEKVLDTEDRKQPGRMWRRIWRRRWYGLAPLVAERLKKVYIMSNGKSEWLEEVRKELIKDAKGSKHSGDWQFAWSWEDVRSSRDVTAGWEEKPVLQLLDMYVGQRAEIFVGNGFSTMTSNLVMLRKHNGLHPVQTRFW